MFVLGVRFYTQREKFFEESGVLGGVSVYTERECFLEVLRGIVGL